MEEEKKTMPIEMTTKCAHCLQFFVAGEVARKEGREKPLYTTKREVVEKDGLRVGYGKMIGYHKDCWEHESEGKICSYHMKKEGLQ